MDNKKLNIAVIGKSSSGKSAFIKSFSNNSEVISSEGKGQTTRSYAEYDFYIANNISNPKAFIKLLNEDEFVRIRTEQFMDKIRNSNEENEISIEWFKEQIEDEDYKIQIDNFALYSNDFFNVEEFGFLDDNITITKIKNKYEEFLKIFTNNTIDNLDTGIDEKKLKSIFKRDKELEIEERENIQDIEIIEELFSSFYGFLYKELIACIEKRYSECIYFKKENGVYKYEFDVTVELKEVLTLFLKVIETEGSKEKKSLTGLVSKVNIKSAICDLYLPIFQKLNIDCISLLDTYGLDHDQSCSDIILKERYNRIFKKDYPQITNVFFVEALHAGSSNDFTRAINNLYSECPNIMTYIIGTYIDNQEEKIFNDFKEWFCSLEKNIYEYPKLNGKVIDYLFEKNDVIVMLKKSSVHPTLAKKRIDIMRKRFGPFCGKVESILKNDFYKQINLVTIESIFNSIIDREHLGEEYINIDKVISSLSKKELIKPFISRMIQYSTKRFVEIYGLTAARTRWRVRVNLEKFILGFDGSTIDATWFRVFNDSFNNIFTKEINKNSLSSCFEMYGNEKIAFDELMNTFFPYLFNKSCDDENLLNYWKHEIDCKGCSCDNIFDSYCIWGILINAIGHKEFNSRKEYDTVYDWLVSTHNLNEFCDEFVLDKLVELFCGKMKRYFIPLCREHNIEIAKKKIRKSEKTYQEAKECVFNEYTEYYDSDMKIKEFFMKTN